MQRLIRSEIFPTFFNALNTNKDRSTLVTGGYLNTYFKIICQFEKRRIKMFANCVK
jgi:hypothetical protein